MTTNWSMVGPFPDDRKPFSGVASALACDLRPSLSAIRRVPTEALTWLGWPVDFGVPLRRSLAHVDQCGG
jgi:hypothetical protein